MGIEDVVCLTSQLFQASKSFGEGLYLGESKAQVGRKPQLGSGGRKGGLTGVAFGKLIWNPTMEVWFG